MVPTKPRRVDTLGFGRKTFAEFFAGIGLVHKGLRGSGWHCVYANDISSTKKVMYEAEFGEARYYHVEDVWRTDEVIRHLTSAPLLATASFPCVDLSLAGHWRGFGGKHSSTYFGFIEALARLHAQPPMIVMLENVCGFLTSGNGQDFRRAVTELAGLGYWIDAIVLDARWFVPQSRPRLFVFGFHRNLKCNLLVRRTKANWIDDSWREVMARSAVLRPQPLVTMLESLDLPTGVCAVPLRSPRQRKYSLQAALDLGEEQEWWIRSEVIKHYEMMETPSRSRVDALLASGVTAAGTAFRRTRRGKTRTEVRFDMAGCLRTPKGGSAKQIVVHTAGGDLRMRWMSAREYARLQGAPHYRITVPELQAMYGFGDAVCVPAIAWIDSNILTPIADSVLGCEVKNEYDITGNKCAPFCDHATSEAS